MQLLVDLIFDYKEWKKVSKTILFKKCISNCLNLLSISNNKIEVCIFLTSNNKIKQLNHKFLKNEKETDVLSFPNFNNIDDIKDKSQVYLGDIALAYQFIQIRSKNLMLDFNEYVTHTLTHGLLHLLGYRHDTLNEEKKMRKVEKSTLFSLGLEGERILKSVYNYQG